MQRAMQDEAIERLGLIDSGVERLILNSAWSGRTGDKEPPALTSEGMRDLIECGEPVLLVGYSTRFMRSTTDAGTLMRELHRRGSVVYVASDDLLSTRDHGDIIAKVLSGWNYSNDLSKTMHAANRVRWIEQGLPTGMPPFGFNRDWSHHPENAQTVRNVFADYDSNNGSTQVIADRYEIDVEQVKVILRNPAYKAVAQFNGEERPASFAAIVDPDLWERVAARREARHWASGGRRTARPSMVRNKIYCQCGRRLRLNGTSGQGRRRIRHLPPLCDAWGEHEHKSLARFEDTIKTVLRSTTISDAILDRAVEIHIAETSAPPRDEISARRRAKQRRDLRTAYDAGEIDAATYISQDAALAAQDAPAPTQPANTQQWTPESIEDFRELFKTVCGRLGEMLALAEDDQSEQWAKISAWAFSRFEYHADNDLRYTPGRAADAQLISVALPEVVTVGGEGLEPPTFSV
jgi:DNA invertase Pin-like site-specific DNA recombinase